MPNSVPHNYVDCLPTRRAPFTVCCLAVIFAAICAPAAPFAQTLAHPGWVGNGLNVNPWWQRAIFYQVATPGADGAVDLKDITTRLDSLRSLGVDALLLPAPDLPQPGTNGAMPNLDDFDDLVRQAGSHDIRVLLTLRAPSATADLSGLARFWLNRGIAGLYVTTPAGSNPEQTQTMVESLHKLTASTLGQRIIISDLDAAATAGGTQGAARPARHAGPVRASATAAQLHIDSRPDHLPSFDAAGLRPLLAQTIAQPNLLVDLQAPASTDTHSALAKAVAAIALLTHSSALIDSSANLVLNSAPDRVDSPAQPEQQAARSTPVPLPPGTYLPYTPYVPPPKPHRTTAPKTTPTDPLTAWYGLLGALHNNNAAIRSGSKIFLDFDSQNSLVWVNRPASPSLANPPVIVACNLSASPVQLSLEPAMKSLNLHGTFLRPLLRSFDAMGAQDLNSVTLPPFGVYIGELRR